jgi:hypothetical protein
LPASPQNSCKRYSIKNFSILMLQLHILFGAGSNQIGYSN